MATYYFNTLWWSVVYDPEDQTSYGSGSLNYSMSGGIITGLGKLENYFFVGQEGQHHIYSFYNGLTPLNFLRTIPYGLNYHKTIAQVEKDGAMYLIYLAHNKELRMTNGPTFDQSISRKYAHDVGIGNLKCADFYSSSNAAAAPCAYYDARNYAYKLFLSGGGASNYFSLNYFVDKDTFTTTADYMASCYSLDPFQSQTSIIGNSNSSGITYTVDPYSIRNIGISYLDFGWIGPPDSSKNIKIHNVKVLYHAHSGCNCTLTIRAYNSIEDPAVAKTETRTLTYNSNVDNLQKATFNLEVQGDYVRLYMYDSVINCNYSIDKIIIDYDEIDAPN